MAAGFRLVRRFRWLRRLRALAAEVAAAAAVVAAAAGSGGIWFGACAGLGGLRSLRERRVLRFLGSVSLVLGRRFGLERRPPTKAALPFASPSVTDTGFRHPVQQRRYRGLGLGDPRRDAIASPRSCGEILDIQVVVALWNRPTHPQRTRLRLSVAAAAAFGFIAWLW